MISFTVKFWVYLLCLIPSILCSLFVLYFLLVDRALRRALNNHVIIVLLCICLIAQVTIYPWMLYYYRSDGSWERPTIFCLIWGFLDWGLYATQTILFAWATIERHILIFHDRWLSTKKRRLLFHYSPIIILLIYCLAYHIATDFFPPCENFIFDFDMICVYFCLYTTYEFYMWQTVAHQIVPNLIIVLFSMALLGRVLWQKHRMNQPVQWKKHRKMTVQLLSISFLYLIFSFPFILVTLMYLSDLVYSAYGTLIPYAEFFSYFIILFFPFVCALSLPNLSNKVKRVLFLGREPRHARGAVQPTGMLMRATMVSGTQQH